MSRTRHNTEQSVRTVCPCSYWMHLPTTFSSCCTVCRFWAVLHVVPYSYHLPHGSAVCADYTFQKEIIRQTYVKYVYLSFVHTCFEAIAIRNQKCFDVFLLCAATKHYIDKKRNESVTMDVEHHLTEPLAQFSSPLPVDASSATLTAVSLWSGYGLNVAKHIKYSGSTY